MLKSFRRFAQLTGPQRHAYFAALGGWTLDAFDFFIFIVCLNAISADFRTTIQAVAFGITLMFAMQALMHAGVVLGLGAAALTGAATGLLGQFDPLKAQVGGRRRGRQGRARM